MSCRELEHLRARMQEELAKERAKRRALEDELEATKVELTFKTDQLKAANKDLKGMNKKVILAHMHARTHARTHARARARIRARTRFEPALRIAHSVPVLVEITIATRRR